LSSHHDITPRLVIFHPEHVEGSDFLFSRLSSLLLLSISGRGCSLAIEDVIQHSDARSELRRRGGFLSRSIQSRSKNRDRKSAHRHTVGISFGPFFLKQMAALGFIRVRSVSHLDRDGTRK
jgi:hypothetical protein